MQTSKTEESKFEVCGIILTGKDKGKQSKRYILEVYENDNYKLEISKIYKHNKESKLSELIKDKIFNLIKK